MVFPRKKCRILLTWIFLVAFAQLLLYAILFSEFESIPRKRLSEKLKLQNLHSSNEFFPGKDSARNHEEISKSKSNFKYQVQSDHLTSNTGSIQKILSRKLENKDLYPHLIMNSDPNKKTTKVKLQENRKILQTNDMAKEIKFVQNSRRETEPDDIFISVKTTKDYHDTRVLEITRTWWNLAKQQTYFFTDAADPLLNKSLGGHLVNSQCNAGHMRAALCCKMASELKFFWKQMRKRWFCHFDDDNYVNLPALVNLLQQYNHSKPIYLGRTSTSKQMKAWDRSNGNREVHFWFATGGAGFCLSRQLVSLMVPYFSGEAFPETCARVGLPDDCTIGFISEYLLNVKLKDIGLFHSHLEWLEGIPQYTFHDQVTFSHGYMGGRNNHIKINGPFTINEDPSRFKSLHCFFFPQTSWCTNNKTTETRQKGNKN